MTAPPDQSDDAVSRAHAAWSPILVPALRDDPVWIDPIFSLGMGADFEKLLRDSLADAGVDVRVAVGPQIEVDTGSDLRFYDELFGRILDDLAPPDEVVFIYFEHDRAPSVWCYAYGPTGMSGRLVTHGDLMNLRGDFRQDPRPFVDYCIAAGRSWLGHGARPKPHDYVDHRFGADVPRYYQVHDKGGANALAAGTAFITTGAALVWVIFRRRKSEDAGSRSRGGVPGHIPGALPALLSSDPQLPASDGKSGAGMSSAMLDAEEELTAVLAARQKVRSRILRAAGLPETLSYAEARELDSEAVLTAAPLTDIAALRVLDWQAAALRSAASGAPAEPVRACFYNPLHPRAGHTALFTGRSGALQVPVCRVCEQQTDRGEDPDVLLVHARSGSTRPVPYYTLDDGYARTGFGAFASLADDIPDTPAALPGVVTRPAGKESLARSIVTSAAAVTLAGLIGAGLGAAGSAVIAARSIPEFYGGAGKYTQSYPRERIEQISSSLAEDPVYIDPSASGVYDAQTQETMRRLADESAVPVRFVATTVSHEDESGGDAGLLAARVAEDLEADGVVVVLNGLFAEGAVKGYEDDYAKLWEVRTAGDALPRGATLGDRAIAVAEAAADLDLERSPDVVPETVEHPLREPPETGPWIAGVPLWNVLRGAAIGFFGSVFTIGTAGLIIRAIRKAASGEADDELEPRRAWAE